MRPSLRARLLSVLAVVPLVLSLATVPAPAAPAAPRSDTLFPSLGHSGYDVRHYDVSLDYSPATNRLEARTRIRAVAATRIRSFALDFVGMRVRAVRVGGDAARWHRRGQQLVVVPRAPVRGRFTVVVEYAGVPRTYVDADGSKEGWVPTKDGAIALGEPVGTMTWIPSNNTPGDKARYTFRITVPRGVQAVANGSLARRVRHGGRTTWTWQARDPMATYLAMVAVGRFKVYRSTARSITGRKVPVWTFADPRHDVPLAVRRALPRVMRFEERLFGPYPFTSTGMVVDDADVGYALETQTRPFYPFDVDAGTLVHEMAHQWYGNSVGFRDWHDIWLAEGFATYAEWLWAEAQGGEGPAERFDALYARPASAPLWRPAPTEFTGPEDLFGDPVYLRGAMTLQALRERIGDADFFAFLKTWARTHRHGTASTAQLVAVAERVSGEQLDALFADWLELDGRPAGY
ncbi:M1 family metallopeptidase [Nocardioides sp. cx-173]|uniref:M1 family metallopeptidase n=1 Tax=Nocardioides sp. cx-173 TaxID=2898796 RepID=UPI001E5E2BB8|nr:M1 family metallopeptidase [Nocardioides sp. cx-173]MCD4524295.1 M1 family metallopeptidase [Nocardioides sp. cx-173]UGB41687.1 M1 family metallopeptidase [Nocardioides sp. cx-173]